MSSSICRVCLCRGEFLTSLFHQIKGVSLGEKIMSCTSVHIDYNDRLPSQICCKCVERVNDSYDFKVLCEDSDSVLRKRLAENRSLLDYDESFPIKTEQNLDVDYLPVKCELKYDHSDNENSRSRFKVRNENDQTEGGNKRQTEERSSRYLNEKRNDNRSEDEGEYSNYCPSDSNSDEIPLSRRTKHGRKRSKDSDDKSNYKKLKKIREGKISRSTSKPAKGSWRLKCECSTCGKVLSNKYGLELHMRIHTGEKPYKCSHCDKSFALRKTLRGHERIHTGEKPLLCSDCGKSFSTHSTLNSHRKSHKSERPFKCSLCPSTYRRRAHLDFHMKIHIGDKTYKCHLCEKGFVTRDYLKSHLISHSGERNFVCNVCGKKMTRSHHLKLHMMTHTGDRPHKCEICDISFIQKGYWMKHMNKHKINEPVKQCSSEKYSEVDEKLLNDNNDIIGNKF